MSCNYSLMICHFNLLKAMFIVYLPSYSQDNSLRYPIPVLHSDSEWQYTMIFHSIKHVLLLFCCSFVSNSLQPRELQHSRIPVLPYSLVLAQTHVH